MDEALWSHSPIKYQIFDDEEVELTIHDRQQWIFGLIESREHYGENSRRAKVFFIEDRTKETL